MMTSKTLKAIVFPLLLVGVLYAYSHFQHSDQVVGTNRTTEKRSPKVTLASLNIDEKEEAFEAMKRGECEYKGIPLHGKVQFVSSFPDIKIQYVESFPDIKVKFVSSFPDDCGEWQEVTSFPDFKVQVVTSFPDIKVQKVSSFPGMN